MAVNAGTAKSIGGVHDARFTLKRAPERLAVEGEILVSYRFRTGSVGLASPGELRDPRVCGGNRRTRVLVVAMEAPDQPFRQPDKTAAIRVSPTARLRVNSVPDEIQQEFDVSAIENVNFVELSAEVATFATLSGSGTAGTYSCSGLVKVFGSRCWRTGRLIGSRSKSRRWVAVKLPP